MLYLVKANDDLISHCRCDRPPIGAPAQMDCPWCGCGWLFMCPTCRKAFTIAIAREVDLTWDQLAHKDLDGKWGRQPSAQEIADWIGFMKVLQKNLQEGKQYVYIDGWVFPMDQRNLQFEGWHARHDLEIVPHALGRAALDRILGGKEYWQSRRILSSDPDKES